METGGFVKLNIQFQKDHLLAEYLIQSKSPIFHVLGRCDNLAIYAAALVYLRISIIHFWFLSCFSLQSNIATSPNKYIWHLKRIVLFYYSLVIWPPIANYERCLEKDLMDQQRSLKALVILLSCTVKL